MYPYLGTLPTFPSGSLPQYTTTYGHPAPFPAAAPMTVLPSDPLKYPLQSSYQQSTYTPASYTYQPTLQSSVPPQAPTQGPPSAPQPVTPRATATTPRPKEEVAAAVAEVAAAAQASQERHQASTPRPPADSEPAAPHSDDDSAWDVPKPTAEEPAQGQVWCGVRGVRSVVCGLWGVCCGVCRRFWGVRCALCGVCGVWGEGCVGCG